MAEVEATEAERARSRPVACDGGERPFGELTREQVAARGDELSEASGLGHGSPVAAVAVAWRTLAKVMEQRGLERVDELEPDELVEHARRLWVLPPGGSLL